MNLKFKNDQRGAISPLLIVVAILVVAGIGLAGWKVVSDSKASPSTSATNTASNSSTSSTGVSSSCLAAYHDSNLCHFAEFAPGFTKTAYTAKITNTESGATSTMTLENDGNGNTDLSGSSNGQVINAISLDGTEYVQASSSGPWIAYPSGTSAPTTSPTSSMNLGFGTGITFKSMGTSACGSMTCFKYQISDTATPSATQFVFFDNSKYKLREWQYTSGTTNTDMTITYQAVSITKPSPVESLSQAE